MTFPLTRSRSRARFFGTPFSPVSLFANGEQGAWYDPSDLTTLFQDATGTTPTTMETRARLMLDKSGRGNHATAPSDASSPILRARYNLLTWSEDFSNAAWVKLSSSVANVTTTPDPLGGTTAREVTASAGAAIHGFYQTVAGLAVGVGVPATFSAYFRYVNHQYVRFAFVTGSGVQSVYVDIDLLNGVIVNTGPYSTATQTAQSIVSVGNGWYRVSITGTLPSATNYTTVYFRDSSSNVNPESAFSFTALGTEKFLMWGADLRTSSDAALNIPAYQSITTATSYDTNGFPPYLAFDGTDDSFSTASIDFTGTDEMTVFAGVTKLSDAAQGVVVELSAAIASNNGAFLLAAPDGATQTFGWDSKGTLQVDAVATSQAAPRNAVLTGIGDIGADICTIRVNGAQADTDTGDQGTGNFGNYPLFIGRRNNTSFPFNGRIYSLIIRGAATTTPLIASTESWINQKMRGNLLPVDYNFLTTAGGDQLTTADGDPLYTSPIYP